MHLKQRGGEEAALAPCAGVSSKETAVARRSLLWLVVRYRCYEAKMVKQSALSSTLSSRSASSSSSCRCRSSCSCCSLCSSACFWREDRGASFGPPLGVWRGRSLVVVRQLFRPNLAVSQAPQSADMLWSLWHWDRASMNCVRWLQTVVHAVCWGSLLSSGVGLHDDQTHACTEHDACSAWWDACCGFHSAVVCDRATAISFTMRVPSGSCARIHGLKKCLYAHLCTDTMLFWEHWGGHRESRQSRAASKKRRDYAAALWPAGCR